MQTIMKRLTIVSLVSFMLNIKHQLIALKENCELILLSQCQSHNSSLLASKCCYLDILRQELPDSSLYFYYKLHDFIIVIM